MILCKIGDKNNKNFNIVCGPSAFAEGYSESSPGVPAMAMLDRRRPLLPSWMATDDLRRISCRTVLRRPAILWSVSRRKDILPLASGS